MRDFALKRKVFSDYVDMSDDNHVNDTNSEPTQYCNTPQPTRSKDSVAASAPRTVRQEYVRDTDMQGVLCGNATLGSGDNQGLSYNQRSCDRGNDTRTWTVTPLLQQGSSGYVDNLASVRAHSSRGRQGLLPHPTSTSVYNDQRQGTQSSLPSPNNNRNPTAVWIQSPKSYKRKSRWDNNDTDHHSGRY